MKYIQDATQYIEDAINKYEYSDLNPATLYDPMAYILSIGGKRLRPAVLLATASYFDKPLAHSLDAALAVEIFHNFTLVHDDIMDAATLRRGMETVHHKYNLNQAVISGDVMLIRAYEHLLKYENDMAMPLIKCFSIMARQVCEGQQLDIDFEKRDNVTISDYIQMITFKTSVLLAACLQMGAITAGQDQITQKALYEFGKNIGIAFQIQDDILDTFGDPASVGKKPGGDIIQNKKTYLFLKALELGDPKLKEELVGLYSADVNIEEAVKVERVKKIFQTLVVKEYANQVKEAYRDLAISHLKSANLPLVGFEELSSFADYLIVRTL